MKGWIIEGTNTVMLEQESVKTSGVRYFDCTGEINLTTSKKMIVYLPLFSLKEGKYITHYEKGDLKLSASKFNKKRTAQRDSDSDAELLRLMANRIDLEGYTPIYMNHSPKLENINIMGKIQDTGSVFITLQINGMWAKNKVLYRVDYNGCAEDEYNRLSVKHKGHAIFQKISNSGLSYVKINNEFALRDSSRKDDLYLVGLETAKNQEKIIRKSVRDRVERAVFKDNLTRIRADRFLTMIGQLKNSINAGNLECAEHQINVIEIAIEDYLSKVKD